mmetsp:Transcript_49563/g.127960  ORF Transcript_49563/g.127960 Transcript_49563/m.127960 type:complete len:276 (-) Transcript_49563:23-850(-)
MPRPLTCTGRCTSSPPSAWCSQSSPRCQPLGCTRCSPPCFAAGSCLPCRTAERRRARWSSRRRSSLTWRPRAKTCSAPRAWRTSAKKVKSRRRCAGTTSTRSAWRLGCASTGHALCAAPTLRGAWMPAPGSRLRTGRRPSAHPLTLLRSPPMRSSCQSRRSLCRSPTEITLSLHNHRATRVTEPALETHAARWSSSARERRPAARSATRAGWYELLAGVSLLRAVSPGKAVLARFAHHAIVTGGGGQRPAVPIAVSQLLPFAALWLAQGPLSKGI